VVKIEYLITEIPLSNKIIMSPLITVVKHNSWPMSLLVDEANSNMKNSTNTSDILIINCQGI